jgi:hypothetical protein
LGSCTRKNNAPKTKQNWVLKKEEWHTQNEKIGGFFFLFQQTIFWVFEQRKNTHSQNKNIGYNTPETTKLGFDYKREQCTQKDKRGFFGFVQGRTMAHVTDGLLASALP